MEFKLTLPGGAVIEFKREPMEDYKFYTLCWTLCLAIVLPAFFAIRK